jgi:hypothetical protein
VVVDRVLRLVLAVLDVLQQGRVELLLLRRGVHLEVGRELAPELGGGLRVVAQLDEPGEPAAEGLVVVQDQADDVGHRASSGELMITGMRESSFRLMPQRGRMGR